MIVKGQRLWRTSVKWCFLDLIAELTASVIICTKSAQDQARKTMQYRGGRGIGNPTP